MCYEYFYLSKQSEYFLHHWLQSDIVLDSRSSIPDADGGGEDGLKRGGAEVHHHYFWQGELILSLQEVGYILYKFYRQEQEPEASLVILQIQLGKLKIDPML